MPACRSTILVTLRNKRSVYVRCGQCLNCRLNKRDEWASRALLESLSSTTKQFWTLTFSDEGLETLATQGARKLMRRFGKALRTKEQRKGNPLPVRYFGCLEYGSTTFRPHVHILTFNAVNHVLAEEAYKPHLPRPRHFLPIWPHGHVDCCPMDLKAARYVSKYITKFETEDSPLQPIPFYPKRPALGLHGLRMLIQRHSKGPRRKQPLPDYLSIDGSPFSLKLDQTMTGYAIAYCKEYGVDHWGLTKASSEERRLRINAERDAVSWNKTQRILRDEATKQRLFDATKRQKELRLYSAYSSASRRADQRLTSQNASTDVLDT